MLFSIALDLGICYFLATVFVCARAPGFCGLQNAIWLPSIFEQQHGTRVLGVDHLRRAVIGDGLFVRPVHDDVPRPARG